MLAHSIFILTFSVARIAFEEKPYFYVVITEFYLDFIFLIDMFRILTTPYLNPYTQKITYKRQDIFWQYARKWMIFDLFAFYPLAYLRYNSDYMAGGFNDWENFKNQNYERLPRFYKGGLLIQLIRARNCLSYLKIAL